MALVPAGGPVATTTLDRIWILAASGPAVPDTAVTFARATGRTIVLRHEAPDNAVFATLTFPAEADSTASARTDSVRVAIHPTAGEYAMTLESTGQMPPGGQATFSYAIHFQTPAGAVAKYPSAGLLEQILSPAMIGSDGKINVYAGNRPAADMLRFAIPGPGTYAVIFSR